MAAIASGSHALEATAAGNSVHTDTSAIAQQMDAKNVALLVILQKLTTCNANGKYYRPAAIGADTNGCLGSRSDLCAEQGRDYAPTQAGADANGCKAPSGIPQGTIVAFLTACPSGWTEYTAAAGRFLVGRGSNGTNSYLTLGGATDDTGGRGRDEVKVTVANLPPHHHDLRSIGLRMVRSANGDNHGWFQGLKNESAYDGSERPDVRTKNEGDGDPIENRPPFRVVAWCMKN